MTSVASRTRSRRSSRADVPATPISRRPRRRSPRVTTPATPIARRPHRTSRGSGARPSSGQPGRDIYEVPSSPEPPTASALPAAPVTPVAPVAPAPPPPVAPSLAEYHLTRDGNPEASLARTADERAALARLTPATPNVDWRLGVDGTPQYRDVSKSYKLLAAVGQRLGRTAPPGEECTDCQKGRGPFASCRVAHTADKAISKGACMNCHAGGSGVHCSLRVDQASWVQDYFRVTFPNFSLVQGSPRKTRSTRSRTGGASVRAESVAEESVGEPVPEPAVVADPMVISPVVASVVVDPVASSPVVASSSAVVSSPAAPVVPAALAAGGRVVPPAGSFYQSPLASVHSWNREAVVTALFQVEQAQARAAYDRAVLLHQAELLAQAETRELAAEWGDDAMDLGE